MPNQFDGEKQYRLEVEQALSASLLWVILSAASLQLIVSGYFLYHFASQAGTFSHLVPLGFFIALLSCFFYLRRTGNEFVAHHLMPALMGCYWSMLALGVEIAWPQSLSAEKIILVGFFVTLIGLFYRRKSLYLGVLPLVATHLYIGSLQLELSYLDIFISFIKFPLILFFFMLVLRKQFTDTIKAKVDILQLNHKLSLAVRIDALTGVANRKKFDETYESAINYAMRFDTPLTMLLLDVDYFKKYNDSLGHEAGDHCLIKLSKAIQHSLSRKTDFLCRIGGEEFAMLLPGSNIEQSLEIADKVHQAVLSANIQHPSSELSSRVTVSIGIAQFSKEQQQTLYQQADVALYKAKAAGRNQTYAIPVVVPENST